MKRILLIVFVLVVAVATAIWLTFEGSREPLPTPLPSTPLTILPVLRERCVHPIQDSYKNGGEFSLKGIRTGAAFKTLDDAKMWLKGKMGSGKACVVHFSSHGGSSELTGELTDEQGKPKNTGGDALAGFLDGIVSENSRIQIESCHSGEGADSLASQVAEGLLERGTHSTVTGIEGTSASDGNFVEYSPQTDSTGKTSIGGKRVKGTVGGFYRGRVDAK
ncbi:MAG: hypothetical protein WC712_04840 [Candidatus Brocadiia bacterium]